MHENKNSKADSQKDIKIDYSNIDVEDIMMQIKKKTKTSAAEHVEEIQEDGREQHPLASPDRELEALPPEDSKVKKLLLKIMKPFSPLIKFLVLPVHQHGIETDRKLHKTNLRLDRLDENVSQELLRLSQVLGNLDKRLDTFERNMYDFSDKLGRRMEYTKILHSLAHNLVVELTKLKIEKDNLTVKTRILEKDFEFLRRKEKALEKKAFK